MMKYTFQIHILSIEQSSVVLAGKGKIPVGKIPL